jgi:hypothetical protein
METTAAKQFLISRVIEEAKLEQVGLSEVERKMLYFTEVHPSLPDIYEVNAEFERDYDSDMYEAKIASLLRNAREPEWTDALEALKKEDHYILVMVGQAFGVGSVSADGHRIRDVLIYLGVGIGIVLLLVLKVFWGMRN